MSMSLSSPTKLWAPGRRVFFFIHAFSESSLHSISNYLLCYVLLNCSARIEHRERKSLYSHEAEILVTMEMGENTTPDKNRVGEVEVTRSTAT